MELRTVIKSQKLEDGGPTVLLMKDSRGYYFTGSVSGDLTISPSCSTASVEAMWLGYRKGAQDEHWDHMVPDNNERPVLDLPDFIHRQMIKAAAAVHSSYIQDGWDEEDIYVTDSNGDTHYSEEAQDIFNDYYDRAEEILLLSFRKGA